MTKEARPAKPVRATPAEWAEIDRARGGESRQEFMLRAALGAARGELVPKPARARAKAVAAPAGKPKHDVSGWNRVTSLRPSPPRPKEH